MKAAIVYALRLVEYTHWTEAQALLAMNEACARLELKQSTRDLLRLAIRDHFEETAPTLRSAAPAEDFAREKAGEQAPSRPLTVYPVGLSDCGFELDEEPTAETARHAAGGGL
jgi:hypothetical protein